jgi:hypothetical protein
VGAVAATGTPAVAAPAVHRSVHSAGSAPSTAAVHQQRDGRTAAAEPQCLWTSDLYRQGNQVFADVESPCGDQVNLVLLRDGVVVRDLCCAQAISTSYPCASTAPVTWGTNTGLSLVTDCTSAVVPNVIGRGEFQAISVLTAAGLGDPVRQGMFTCDFSTGTVIDQNPAPNTLVPSGSVVTLTIARIPPRPHPCI